MTINRLHKFTIILSGIILFGSLISCSTKKNTFTRRVYHNVTSHYNGYWNGNESVKKGEKQLAKDVLDDYSKIIPVYNFGDKNEAKTIIGNMDRGIEKASIVIQRHTMKFRGKEYCRWIDDSYMMIGKSYFYKQEYIAARRTFNFIITEYPENSIRFDAMIWLVKTYNQMEHYEKSEAMLNTLENSIGYEDVSIEAQREYPLVYANYLIRLERYDEAISKLYRGIEINNNKQLVTRLKFILAQIYHKKKDFEKAVALYNEVIRRNPNFDMEFQSKIKLAKAFVDDEGGESEDIIKILTKMLKEFKNEDYRDQIYYALAEIAIKDNEDTLAINHLRSSVRTSLQNTFQKVTSSLTLADIYFEDSQYEDAQLYYDTAMQVMPPDYPNYSELLAKTDILNSLVIDLKTIQLQDSLQRLAVMPEDERNRIIDLLIEEYVEKEEKRLEEEQLRAQNLASAGPDQNFAESSRGGNWYFYNPSILGKGFTQFTSKWGRRKLEDNWRLSDKQISVPDFSDEEMATNISDSTQSDSIIVKTSNPRDRNYYLQNVPFTAEQMIISDSLLVDAYFSAGILYKEGLKDIDKAIETLELLNKRYPNNKHILQSCFHLYRIYLALNIKEKSDFYGNFILLNFPDTDYAKIVEDPEYFKKLQEQESIVEKTYVNAYEAYENQQYYVVLNLCEEALNSYSDTALTPRFEYLKALSLGKIEVVDTMEVALRNLISNYPLSTVVPFAQNVLATITGMPLTFTEDGKLADDAEEVFESPYSFDEESIHNYILVVKQDVVNLNALKTRISDFNQNYYSLVKLSITSFILNEEYQLISVSRFNNQSVGIDYFNNIATDEYVFALINPDDYQQFIISSDNYPIFYKNKNIEEYLEFYKRNYNQE